MVKSSETEAGSLYKWQEGGVRVLLLRRVVSPRQGARGVAAAIDDAAHNKCPGSAAGWGGLWGAWGAWGRKGGREGSVMPHSCARAHTQKLSLRHREVTNTTRRTPPRAEKGHKTKS